MCVFFLIHQKFHFRKIKKNIPFPEWITLFPERRTLFPKWDPVLRKGDTVSRKGGRGFPNRGFGFPKRGPCFPKRGNRVPECFQNGDLVLGRPLFCLQVGWSVCPSQSPGGKLYFHAPIGPLVSRYNCLSNFFFTPFTPAALFASAELSDLLYSTQTYP